MTLGSTLGHYTLVRKLGGGGMGEVYLAQDTRLGRHVALKILRPEVAQDEERRARFEREARAVAALNHPNIVTLFSIEQASGHHFITMEYVAGVTLSGSIPPTGLPVKRFFELAVPLVDAISAAHAQGVTHRDLKPDNVMVSDTGRVKVLDFGLAKLRAGFLEDAGRTTHVSHARTMRGEIVGTLAYMSPEQAEAKEVDHRSDIFSLGILLHEMMTGRRPFAGDSAASILSSLLRDAPAPVDEVRPDVPPRLGRLIQRCLEKEPARRYQSAADLRTDLAELQQEIESGTMLRPPPPATSRRPLYLGGTAAAAVLLVALAYWRVGGGAEDPAEEGPGDIAFSQLTHAPGEELFPSLSPDGRTIVYAAATLGNADIYSQRVGGENAINLTKDSPADDTQPAFAPDGERIAFRSERDGGGIFVMGATGESVRRLTRSGYHPAWSPDGQQIAFVTQSVSDPALRFTTSEMWTVSLATGESRRLQEGDAAQPSWSPSGRRIAYWGRTDVSGATSIWTIAADGGAPVRLTTGTSIDWNPVWSADGRWLYFSSNRGGSMNLWRIRVEESSGTPLGRPQAVTTGAGAASQHLTISRDGRRIAYVSRVEAMNLQKVGFDPATGTTRGAAEWITRGSRTVAQPDASPDGTRLAFNSTGKQEDIFVAQVDGTGLQQLTDDPFQDRAARWSPDGQRIAFYSDRTGKYEIWIVERDGGTPRQLTRSPGAHYPVWSPDGRAMAYSTHAPNGAFIFDLTKPWDQQKVRPLPTIPDATQTYEIWSWSPDGRQLAGQKHLADLSHAGIGVHEIGSSEIRWLTDFGEWPVWLRDSRRLLFSHHGQLFLLDTGTGKYDEVLSLPQPMLGSVGLAADDRTIYFTFRAAEADVWLMTLK